MLKRLDDALWIAEGPEVPFLGVPYPTRMAVVRLDGGSLWIWSPVGLVDELRREVDALGPVRDLVTPNKIHHLFLEEWARVHPEARVHAAPGLARRKRSLAFASELGDAPDPAWAGEIDQVVVRGSFFMEELLFFHRASRTLLIGDLVQKHDTGGMSFWQAALMRLDGLVGEKGSTPREWRASFLRRGPAREAVRTALAWNPERLVIAHGSVPEGNACQIVRDSLAWLAP